VSADVDRTDLGLSSLNAFSAADLVHHEAGEPVPTEGSEEERSMSRTVSGGAPGSAYDVIVMGAGPVGQTVADRVTAAGFSVAVVERELVGGECSYWGCVPSKAMLRPVIAVSDARRVDGAREAVSGPINAAGVFDRRNRYVTNWDDDGQADWVKGIGAELVRGHARLDGDRRIAVVTPDDQLVVLEARQAVVICTGSRAAIPDIPGIAEANAWTNRKATDSSMVPGTLAVIGGGPLGAEMATAWHGLGASVTLIEPEPRLLTRMEPFAGELVADALRTAGVDVRTGVSVSELQRRQPDGPTTLLLDDGSELEADEVLFATGRTPNTEGIGLETVGLTPGMWLDVGDTGQVLGPDHDWLFAAGDVNHRALLTHQGKYQARIIGDVIAARAAGRDVETRPWSAHTATADTYAVPQVVFTDPEAAAVGMTADHAARAGRRVRAVDVDLGRAVPGAYLYADGYRGRARMVVDLDDNVLLGVTFVGPGVAELLHSATIAVAAQVPIERLWHAVPCFPTISEVWLRLLEAYRG
jgi:pyruvate/2-oxoglutarate dehydrogenase complex dihydrolipoamide dehydrogenase (E3) component